MGVYVVTGSASGMGRSTAEQLRWEGHRVIGVDLHRAEVQADLSTVEGRQRAIDEILASCNGRLDGAVLAAGLGPIPGNERLIASVNFLGVVELLEGMHDVLAAAGNAKVVIFSSNSTTTIPGIPKEVVDAFYRRDIDQALEIAAQAGPQMAPNFIYAGSKTAITHWMRTIGVTEDWAGQGIRVNALAPGAIRTPLIEKQLADPKLAPAIKAFPVPVREFGKPEEVAQWAIFMLSPAANFLCGSVIFLDGGTDAYFRADSWPKAMGMDELPLYQQKMEEFARGGEVK
ncbi:SDR family oxidoreductase [Scrofimicrobium sp. R131]|uniref:SDR family oxidoreductase n=1 Tax=Scrofimicrobium appendicitidis TaxID=3079930 RepID=A0AAU7V8U4_9ACTO